MPKYAVDVQGSSYEVDAPDENTAWQWAVYTHKNPEKPKEKTWGDVAKDVGVTALKGAVGLPQAAAGLLDIPTLGLASKGLEAAGVRFADTQKMLDQAYSPAQQEAFKRVESADGFVPTIQALAKDPSVAAHMIGQSIPQMLGGAGVGKLALKAAPVIGDVVAAALGEGVLGAGSAASQIREGTPEGLLTPKQALAALGSGVGTAAFGVLGGKAASSKLGQRLGLSDIDTMLVRGGPQAELAGQAKAGFFKSVAASGFSEGVLEELPQSVQEQMWQNWATDKPLTDGLGKAAATGLVVGSLAGGAAGGFGNLASGAGPTPPQAENIAGQPVPPGPEAPPSPVPPGPEAPPAQTESPVVATTTIERDGISSVKTVYRDGSVKIDGEQVTPPREEPNGPANDAVNVGGDQSGVGVPVPPDTAAGETTDVGDGAVGGTEPSAVPPDVGTGAVSSALKDIEAAQRHISQIEADPSLIKYNQTENVIRTSIKQLGGTQLIPTFSAGTTTEQRATALLPILKMLVAKGKPAEAPVTPAPISEAPAPISEAPEAPAPVGEAPVVKTKPAQVDFNGKRGIVGNESVLGGLRRVTADDYVALDTPARVGSIILTGLDRQANGVKGRASEVLTALTKWADANNERLLLSPAASGDLKQPDLIKWYERNGFTTTPDGLMERNPPAKKAIPKAPISEAPISEAPISEAPISEAPINEEKPAAAFGIQASRDKAILILKNNNLPRSDALLNSFADAQGFIDPQKVIDHVKDQKAKAPAEEVKPSKEAPRNLTQEEIDTKIAELNADLDASKTDVTRLAKQLADQGAISQEAFATLKTNSRDQYASKEDILGQLEGALPPKGDTYKQELELGTSGKVDAKFSTFTTVQQALDHVIKTGNAFEKLIAQRLRPFMFGVEYFVVTPENLADKSLAVQENLKNARGLYQEFSFPSSTLVIRQIFIRSHKFGASQGSNIRTILHEALHAATVKKINTGLKKTDAAVSRITNDLRNLMDEVGAAYKASGIKLDIPAVAFENVKEFVTYGMTDPALQKFMATLQGKKQSFFSQFVENVRKFFNFGPQDQSAFMDLVALTDTLLSTRDQSTARGKSTSKMEETKPEILQEAINATNANAGPMRQGNAKAGASQFPYTSPVQDFMRARTVGDKFQVAKLWLGLSGGTVFNKVLLSAMSPHHIKQMYGKDLQSISDVADALAQMDGKTDAYLKQSSDIIEKWADILRKNPAGAELLHKTMNESTEAGIDPSTTEGRAPNSKDTVTSAAKRVELANAWRELGRVAGAHQVYIAARDFHSDRFQLNQTLLLQRVERSLGARPDTTGMTRAEATKANADYDDYKTRIISGVQSMFEQSKVAAPYFPLFRVGSYWVQVGKGANMGFDMSETAYENQKKLEFYKSQYPDEEITSGSDIQKTRDYMQSVSTFLKKSLDAVEAFDIGKESKENLKDTIYQSYLETLPEISMRKHFIHRKSTAFYNADAFRGFVKSAYHTSAQLARMEMSNKALNAVDSARAAVKGMQGAPNQRELEAVVSELQRRVQYAMKPADPNDMMEKVANATTNISFYYYLSSASSAIMQLFSVPTFSYPQLLSEFPKAGARKVTSVLGKYSTSIMGSKASWTGKGSVTYPSYDNVVPKFEAIYSEADQIVKTARELYNKNKLPKDRMGELERNTVLDTLAAKVPEAQRDNFDKRRAYEEGVLNSVIDATLTSDFFPGLRKPSADIASRNKILDIAHKASAGLFHSMEKNSREITYMTAYDLARGEGMSHADAVNKATELSFKALGNYGRSNRPGVLNNPVARMVLQFKRFPIETVFYLGKNMIEIVSNLKALSFDKTLTADERATAKAAARAATIRFSGTLAMTATFAGVMGLPFPIVKAVELIIMGLGELDDEDEDELMRKDPNLWMREWTRQTFKNEAIADALLYGPATVATNVDLHSRLTLNDMFFKDTAIKQSQDVKSEFQQWIVAMLGPIVGMGVSGAQAWDYFSNGNMGRAVETLMPAGLRNVLVAARYANEGVKTPKGRTVFESEEVNVLDISKKMFGFSPQEIALELRDNVERKGVEVAVLQERTSLMNDYYEARSADDMDAEDTVLDNIDAFNDKYPAVTISGKNLKESLKRHDTEEASAERGLVLSKKLRGPLGKD